MADLTARGLVDEPVISESIKSGADIVTFSGDKLLGGPQAGIVVGRSEYIEKLRKEPLYRALRVSKLICGALEATLESHLRGNVIEEVPVLNMLAMTPDDLMRRCVKMIENLKNANLVAEIVQGRSAVGGGAAPTYQPESPLIVLSHSEMSAAELERRLRRRELPIIVRIIDDKVAIDLRTVSENEEAEVIDALDAL
jgi:L-seryl-tRNA(Ser) seleniumtransferase